MVKKKREKKKRRRKEEEKERWNTRRIQGTQADVEQKLLLQKVGKGRSWITKKFLGGLKVVLPQARSPTDGVPRRAPREQSQL